MTAAPEWLPSRDLADRIRRWGLVAEAVYITTEDGNRFVELSLTLRGEAKEPPGTTSVLYQMTHLYTGHTFRSIIPEGYVSTPDIKDSIWLSSARICSEKLTLRTLQPVTLSDEAHERVREMEHHERRNLWTTISKNLGLPAEVLFGLATK